MLLTTASVILKEATTLCLILGHLQTGKDSHDHLLIGFKQVLWHGIHSSSDPVGHGYGILDLLLVLHGKEVTGTDMALCNFSNIIFFKQCMPNTVNWENFLSMKFRMYNFCVQIFSDTS